MYVRFCAYCQQHSEEGGLCAANTGTEHGKKYDQYSWNKHMTKQWRKYIEYLYSSLHNDRSVSKISVTLRFRWPASTASTRGSTTMSSVTRLTLVVFENHVVSRWSLLHFYGNPRAYSRAWSLGVSRKWASLELFIPWASRAMICLLRCLLVLNGHYWLWRMSCDRGLTLF